MMTAMPDSPGRGAWQNEAKHLAAFVGVLWLVLGLGAWIYARMKSIPASAAVPIAAAFLIEVPFYLLAGFDSVRAWLAKQGRFRVACLLAGSAMLPWVVYSLASGDARLAAFLLLLAVAVAVPFWYLALPVVPWADILFLGAVAGIYLSKVFDRIYVSPVPKLSISVLGHLMLIRTAATAVLQVRRNVKADFRFIPNRHEWMAGLGWFAAMLPFIGTAYWALGLVKLRPHPYNVGVTALVAAGTFFGILWVVALSEEFFFRGLLQQWIEQWTDRPLLALVLASVLFGSAHLGFHHIFPNWRWAIVAGILGIFCGMCWRRAHSVQAAMVSHALIVTVWLTFFQ
jgi:uncharacterized protein